jgi:hypothetical protein
MLNAPFADLFLVFIGNFFPSIFPDVSPFYKKGERGEGKRWIPEFSKGSALFYDSFTLYFKSVLKPETLTLTAPVIVGDVH